MKEYEWGRVMASNQFGLMISWGTSTIPKRKYVSFELPFIIIQIYMNTDKDNNKEQIKPDGHTVLATAPCPDCEGTGIVVGVRIEPRCCGNLNEYGGCCNYPVPDQVAEPEQCERCEATGQVPK